MKKLNFFIAALCCSLPCYAKPINIQLTVWNMTQHEMQLNCTSLQENVEISPKKLKIEPNDSPIIHVNTKNLGRIVRCRATGTAAEFTYTILKNDREKVTIPKLPGKNNFHYDPVYPGALDYSAN